MGQTFGQKADSGVGADSGLGLGVDSGVVGEGWTQGWEQTPRETGGALQGGGRLLGGCGLWCGGVLQGRTGGRASSCPQKARCQQGPVFLVANCPPHISFSSLELSRALEETSTIHWPGPDHFRQSLRLWGPLCLGKFLLSLSSTIWWCFFGLQLHVWGASYACCDKTPMDQDDWDWDQLDERGHSQMMSAEREREGVTQIVTQ